MITNYTRILRDNHTVEPYIVVLTKNVDPRTVQDRLTLKCTATEGALPAAERHMLVASSRNQLFELLNGACSRLEGSLPSLLRTGQAVADVCWQNKHGMLANEGRRRNASFDDSDGQTPSQPQ